MFSDPTVQHMFPLQATYCRQPLPHVTGSPVSEYYELIRLPTLKPSVFLYGQLARLTASGSISLCSQMCVNSHK
jgi:hypothetical protein